MRAAAWLCGAQQKRASIEGEQMTTVALVSGGSRGIGAAISKALQAAGYKVAANYAGNDAAAAKFKEETGIPVYKWEVSSYEQCVEGAKSSRRSRTYRYPHQQ